MRRPLALFLALAFVSCSHSSDIPVSDFASFVRNMQDAGFTVASDPSPSDNLFPFMESRILVDDEPMQIYTFANAVEASYGVSTISADGTKVDQIAINRDDPVFYQKDNLIFVYSYAEDDVNEYLKTLLGEPAFPRPQQPSSSAAASSSLSFTE